MAGLVPAIHVFLLEKQGVDARHKAGHDGASDSSVDIERQTNECRAMRSVNKAKAKASHIRGPETIRLR
jgi:hypothetical protein